MEDQDKSPENEESQKKKTGRGVRVLIIVGLVLTVIIVGVGGAYLGFHDNPRFCNAICHSPMDNYVVSYETGNNAQEAAGHAQAGVGCLDCHEASLDEQITEGVAWVSGDFVVDETGFLVNGSGEASGTREFCFRCHDDGDSTTGKDWEDIVVATTNWGDDEGVNPHKSHDGDEQCLNCHSAHRTSVIACDECHGWKTPEDWVKPKLY